MSFKLTIRRELPALGHFSNRDSDFVLGAAFCPVTDWLTFNDVFVGDKVSGMSRSVNRNALDKVVIVANPACKYFIKL